MSFNKLQINEQRGVSIAVEPPHVSVKYQYHPLWFSLVHLVIYLSANYVLKKCVYTS